MESIYFTLLFIEQINSLPQTPNTTSGSRLVAHRNINMLEFFDAFLVMFASGMFWNWNWATWVRLKNWAVGWSIFGSKIYKFWCARTIGKFQSVVLQPETDSMKAISESEDIGDMTSVNDEERQRICVFVAMWLMTTQNLKASAAMKYDEIVVAMGISILFMKASIEVVSSMVGQNHHSSIFNYRCDLKKIKNCFSC